MLQKELSAEKLFVCKNESKPKHAISKVQSWFLIGTSFTITEIWEFDQEFTETEVENIRNGKDNNNYASSLKG